MAMAAATLEVEELPMTWFHRATLQIHWLSQSGHPA